MDRREYRTYIEGNTVRKVETVPKRERRIYEEPKRQQISRRTYKNRQKALKMNGKYVMFLAIAAVFCVTICVLYIQIQSKISEKTNSINQIKNEISVLAARNDSLEYSITCFMDIEYICKVAKEELGMVEATGDQVSLYKKSGSEYMKQLEDIPTE